MNSLKLSPVFFYMILTILSGCSGSNSPVTPVATIESLDSMPLLATNLPGSVTSGTGLLGAYELSINPDDLTVELSQKRTSSIGESFMVNGMVYFTKTPCFDCFKLKSVNWGVDNLILRFEIDHPLPMGDTGQPPTASNRLDLDAFDLAAVIKPGGGYLPQVFTKNFKKVFSGVVSNADGYTSELGNLFGDEQELLPYVLAVDNSDTGNSTWNKLGMGETKTFDVNLNKLEDFISFDIYLTFGYGVSATYLTRHEPKYYNPEFNRKAAWKVEARPKGFWTDIDDTTPVNIEIKVWDWQMGATVSTEPNFKDADPSHVFAASEPSSVSVEILGMNNSLQTKAGGEYASGDGSPGNPLVYNIPIWNVRLLSQGLYPALVKVTDERPVLTPLDNRDILIDSEDGVLLDKYELPEYATYQTFTATVASGCTGYCWTEIFGLSKTDIGYAVAVDETGNIYLTGITDLLVNEQEATFISKYDSNGNLQWTRTWGGDANPIILDIAVDRDGNSYAVGGFQDTVDFNPDGGGTRTCNGSIDAYINSFDPNGNWRWVKTWGAGGAEVSRGVTTNPSGDVYITGAFQDTVEFNPSGGGAQTSLGSYDVFLNKFSKDGTWSLARTWGGENGDYSSNVSSDSNGNTCAIGYFYLTADFNPDGGGTQTSNGGTDSFLTKFDSNDNWQWAKRWGGTGTDDECLAVTIAESGDIYVAGGFEETVDFNPDGGSVETVIGGMDAFLSKFGPSGSWQWTKVWGGTDWERGKSVAIHPTGDIYVSGDFKGTVDFNPTGVGGQRTPIQTDAYINCFKTDGTWNWVIVWGGVNNETGKDIAIDTYGNAYVTGGFFESSVFDPAGGDTILSRGLSDCYLSKFNY